MQLNASRIKVLQAQDDLVNSMKEAASKELLRVSNDSKAYKKLLKGLIVQVMEQCCLILTEHFSFFVELHCTITACLS